MTDDERWLEIAGLILDGKPVAWDTIPGGRPPDEGSADALRVIADVAAMHRALTDEQLSEEVPSNVETPRHDDGGGGEGRFRESHAGPPTKPLTEKGRVFE
jgi:hypothetical protein